MTPLRRMLSLFAAAAFAGGAFGANLFQVESTYLGQGEFEYRIRTLPNLLFKSIDITSFALPFTNRVSYGTVPPGWAADTSSPDRAEWTYRSFDPQPRDSEFVFVARSSETTFRTISLKSLGYSFVFNNGQPGSPDVEAVGVAEFSVLVPCPPALADGSSTNRVSDFEPLPPLRIRKLEMNGRNVQGLSFAWVGDFTVRLQASTNLTTWRDVAYLFGSGSSTIWTTNTPLNSLGNFFRLELVGQGHIPPP